MGYVYGDTSPIGFPVPLIGSQGAASRSVDAQLTIGNSFIRHVASEAAVERVAVDANGQHLVELQLSQGGSINDANTNFNNTFGVFSYTVPFTFGVPFALSMSLTLNSMNSATGWADAGSLVDSLNSFDWAGIQNVTLNGESIAYDLLSESGTDWRRSFVPIDNEIPEPGTYALTLLALLALLSPLRRLHQRPASG